MSEPRESQPETVESLLPLPHLAFQVLLVLAGGDQHGYGIAKDIEVLSEGRTRPGTGSLYLSLAKLCEGGLVEETDPPATGAVDSRRKYYRLTDLGRRAAAAEGQRLESLLTVARRRDVHWAPAEPADLVGEEA